MTNFVSLIKIEIFLIKKKIAYTEKQLQVKSYSKQLEQDTEVTEQVKLGLGWLHLSALKFIQSLKGPLT